MSAAGVASGKGAGRDRGRETGSSGDLLVGALLTNSLIRVGTVAGVTFSMMVNAGRSKTVVGSA